MTITELVPAVRRFTASHRRLVAIAIVGALVVVGSTTGFALTAQAAADEARVEAAAAQALERKIIDLRLRALGEIQLLGRQLVDDATAWATSGSPLLTASDVAGLESTSDAVEGVMTLPPLAGATSAELEDLYNSQWAMITGARERFTYFIAQALAAAKVHLDAAPSASAASRQALVDAIAALESAEANHSPLTAPLAALTAGAAGADASQAAAVAAAQAAAAAAAARRSGGVAPRPGSAAASGTPAPTCSSDVLTCVNQIRAYYGFGTLSSNGTLNAASQTCAQRMHDEGAMTHSSATPGFGWWGENIAYGYGSQVSVFNAWMNSAGHRANILRPQFTYMGLGYVASGNWWCQQFGS